MGIVDSFSENIELDHTKHGTHEPLFNDFTRHILSL